MKKILIFGSGSIGNHMSFASRKLGFKVYITDININALLRMKNEIYPRRYKKWDKNIELINFNKVFLLKEMFDLVIIGTPPNSHIELFNKCLKKINFKNILIEKPLTTFKKNWVKKNFSNQKVNIFCGYNHSISKSFLYFLNNLKIFKKNKSILVNWKEGWNGILNAHFWMKNEFSSYLGNLNDGGGSLHEHSHGLHLLNIILKRFKIDLDNIEFSSNILLKKKGKKKYDEYSCLIGRNKQTFFKYETDLITIPADKSVFITDNKSKSIKLVFNYKKDTDAVIIAYNTNKKIKLFKKTRSSEFENELKYIINLKKKDYSKSNINIFTALNVMNIIKRILK